jgi:hypothetical protein
MRKEKLFGGVLILLLLCTCVGVCGASDPVQNDPVIGTWFAADNFVIGSYHAQLVINQDGTAKLTGSYEVPAIELSGSLNEDLIWSSLGDNKYQFVASGKSVTATLRDGTSLVGLVNPVQMGFIDEPNLDYDWSITMTREDSSPGVNFWTMYYFAQIIIQKMLGHY